MLTLLDLDSVKFTDEERINTCDVLRNLVTLVQFKKREKQLWRCVIFGKIAGLAFSVTESNTPPWVFFTFFKFWKWYQTTQRITLSFKFSAK